MCLHIIVHLFYFSQQNKRSHRPLPSWEQTGFTESFSKGMRDEGGREGWEGAHVSVCEREKHRKREALHVSNRHAAAAGLAWRSIVPCFVDAWAHFFPLRCQDKESKKKGESVGRLSFVCSGLIPLGPTIVVDKGEKTLEFSAVLARLGFSSWLHWELQAGGPWGCLAMLCLWYNQRFLLFGG